MALSENAKRVYALMQEGKDPAAIAKALHMSIADVHEHRTAVFAEMDTNVREKRLQEADRKIRRRTTDDELLNLAELLGAGYKTEYIAKKMDRSVPWVHSHKAQALELWDAKKGEELARQTHPTAHVEESGPEPDMVNHPPHYKQGRFECFDVIVALLGVEGAKAFCKGNIIKYRYRAAAKNGDEDIAKADRYMEMLKDLEGGRV